jgi:TRAP-type mannitol/chloroaromatic compound transport system permease small subunit
MLKRILRTVDDISEKSGCIFSFLIIFVMGIVGVDVVLRYGFRSSPIWAHESSIHIFGIYVVMGGAYTLLHNGHVRMDIVYNRLSARKRAILDSVTYFLFFLLFVFVLLWFGTEHACLVTRIHYTTGSVWNSPIWPSRWGLVLATFLLLLQGIASFIRSLSLAITGRQSL